MGYSVKILADSIGPNGKRLTTWELSYPRFVHSEMLTHRLFSRNSASSRAIPVQKMIDQVIADPAMPVWWGKNQAGMQAREELTGDALHDAKYSWLSARDEAVRQVQQLIKLNVHKQIANRILEPWMFITVILSATEFDNWFKLRCHPDAQPEIGHVAKMMRGVYDFSSPMYLDAGEWHLPLIEGEDWIDDALDNFAPAGFDNSSLEDDTETLKKVSVGRCARVSYLTHDGRRDLSEDVKLHDRLSESGHWSPFEHVAQAQTYDELRWSGNFHGWNQYREMIDSNFTKVGR